VNALNTWLIWLGAFGSASMCILVWVVPHSSTLFNSLLAKPSHWPVRRRQALYSVCALAFSAFGVYDALTQYPYIERSLSDLVVIGSATFPFAAAAITGWIFLAVRVVTRATKRALVTPPASAGLPALFHQPTKPVPQANAASG